MARDEVMKNKNYYELIERDNKTQKNISLLEQAKRYRGQINNNLAQMMIMNDRLVESNDILYENYQFMIKNSPDYLAEAAYMLANSFYHLKDYQKTIKYASIATKEFDKIGSVMGRMNTDQLLIAALYKNQELNEANQLFKQFKKESEWIDENITR